ncbi:MAG: S9 family peptidase [Burkholderiales bacterium]|nr:S9 family peptidase [Burkholderiales bacterium]
MRPPRPLDVDTLWQLERVAGLALAPDGERAVCSVTRYSMADNRGASSLWLLPTRAGAPRRLTSGGDRDGQPAWSADGRHIAFIARREQQGERDATPQLYVIPADGGEAERKSRYAPGIEAFRWLPDGRRIVFCAWVWPGLKGAAAQARRHKAQAARKETGYATGEAYYRHFDRNLPQGRVLHLLLLDLASGRVTDLFEGRAAELPREGLGRDAFDVRPDGRRIAFVHDPAPQAMAGQRLALSEIDLASGRIRRLVDDPAWDFGHPCYSPDGRHLAATAAPVGRAHTALAQLALVSPGRGWQALGEGWDRDVLGPLRWSAQGTGLVFRAEQRGRCHLWRLDLGRDRPEMAPELSPELAPEIAHEGGWVQGFDLAGDTLALAVDSAQHPVQVLAARGGAALRRLENFNDRLLAGVRLGAVREVEFEGALGEAVQMWLTFPVGFDPRRRHPLMHVIHGGPHAAAGDTWGWRWNPHLLASRGHVVAQVNYHGSSGFGHAFRHSLIGRQGQLELHDIEAATDWLLRQRWADGRRLVATGGSYGGFLVAWMNGHVPPGRYRAYVCHAGVFDRVATFSADSYPTRPLDLAARYWEDLPRVLAQSPHAFAGAMRTPTLVIHGAQDFRVPDCNGLAYYNTLKALGVEARLLWFPDENHWVLKPRNSRQWYGEFLDWVEQHTPEQPK